jgi:hypothetical protein
MMNPSYRKWWTELLFFKKLDNAMQLTGHQTLLLAHQPCAHLHAMPDSRTDFALPIKQVQKPFQVVHLDINNTILITPSSATQTSVR